MCLALLKGLLENEKWLTQKPKNPGKHFDTPDIPTFFLGSSVFRQEI